MGNKLYVGGLAWATTDDGLRQAFAKYGEIVEANVVMDRDTGRSRGFGFVTFTNDDDAQKALELDGASLDGRTIKVSQANTDRGPRVGYRGGRR